LKCLIGILSTGRKSKEYSRQRQQYWMKGFGIQVSRFDNAQTTLLLLETLRIKNIIIPTHSLKYFEIISQSCTTYHSYAVTKAHDSG